MISNDRFRQFSSTCRPLSCSHRVSVLRARRDGDHVQIIPPFLYDFSNEVTAVRVMTATDRRKALITSLALATLSSSWTLVAHSEESLMSTTASSSSPTQSAPEVSTPFKPYINSAQGYRVSVPMSWEKIEKAGADVLFEDPDRRSTSLGVTVNPVRVSDITKFGSLEVVGEKLLEAERKKESTMSVSLISQSSRQSSGPATTGLDIKLESSNKVAEKSYVDQSGGGALFYEYQYDLDSTRGRKIIFNTVTIFRSNLYILNAAFKCDKDDASCNGSRAMSTTALLRDLSSSFDVILQ
ncbi:hypothetical protein CEUSTIGMA_g1849.t1 [Chlamydomonas eustigma]|uniref:PsbP C-terminal domain-containing protein n=1 Tax=Chlamydomonas eustigma TaxID=1157962 RepID=A0A250WUA1_9CHLO|nr:hypothetical protein CEUSTIGMA_g1849.t1 [Chlamydomonas eustigma]|eukprot:GAX74401.1 hypothetical protein CEUSTIGMA_g1849.t1 [Chlamydomonas eustigma]